MTLPKLVYVGPFDVKVKARKSLEDNLAGAFDEGNAEVKIERGMSPGMTRDTLMHELLHAVIYLAGIRKTSELDNASEEKLVVALSPWLLALLQDNPELVAYLTESERQCADTPKEQANE